MMRSEIQIGDHKIGENHPIFICAECGITCNYDLETAKQLIDVVHDAGADAIKFIFWFPEEIFCDKKLELTFDTVEGTKTQNMYETIDTYRFSLDEWREVKKYADQKGVIVFSTVNSPSGIEYAEEIGLEAYKLSSWDHNYFPLWKKIAAIGKPMLIDTGPVNTVEMAKVMQLMKDAGNDQSILVHCFHTKTRSEKNMRSIPYMRHAFDSLVGYSSPDSDDDMDIMAITLGAVFLEKKISLSNDFIGLDHIYAKEPDAFKKYVKMVRECEESLGVFDLVPSEGDLRIRKTTFRHIVANQDISKGTVLEESMLEGKREEYAVSPEYTDLFVGRELKRDLKENESVTWDDV
ncbi:N-acetylneuraminate synthase family protein [Patescibacteria group bacterium]|nr:N-acetylneuraminate synthase family protein [Patescibacteria group bacterium]